MNAEVGDLVMDFSGDLGTISLVDTNETWGYHILWFNGYLQGYITVHKLEEVWMMRKNLQLNA
jgi:hypothetical protein